MIERCVTDDTVPRQRHQTMKSENEAKRKGSARSHTFSIGIVGHLGNGECIARSLQSVRVFTGSVSERRSLVARLSARRMRKPAAGSSEERRTRTREAKRCRVCPRTHSAHAQTPGFDFESGRIERTWRFTLFRVRDKAIACTAALVISSVLRFIFFRRRSARFPLFII